jgi:hypothetical protein
LETRDNRQEHSINRITTRNPNIGNPKRNIVLR